MNGELDYVPYKPLIVSFWPFPRGGRVSTDKNMGRPGRSRCRVASAVRRSPKY